MCLPPLNLTPLGMVNDTEVMLGWRCMWGLSTLSVCQVSFPYTGWFLLYACWRRRSRRRWWWDNPCYPSCLVYRDGTGRFIISIFCWRFGLVVMRWPRSTKLLYAEPGTGMGDRVRGSTPGAGKIYLYINNQPPRSTEPGHAFVGRRKEYQPKGGDALRLGSKGRYGS